MSVDAKREREIKRELAWYDRTTDVQVGSETLKGIGLDELRRMFGVSPDDVVDPLLYHYYPVAERHVSRLQRCVETKIEWGRFDYFVEASRRRT